MAEDLRRAEIRALVESERRMRLLCDVLLAINAVSLDGGEDAVLEACCDASRPIVELFELGATHLRSARCADASRYSAVLARLQANGDARAPALAECVDGEAEAVWLDASDAHLMPEEVVAAGLRAARVLPVRASTGLCAVLVVYVANTAALDDAWCDTFDRVAEQLSLLFERKASWVTKRWLSLVVQETDNAVVILDRQGRIEWVNQGFERYSGYSLPEIIGRAPASFLAGPETSKETMEEIRAALMAGRKVCVQLLNYHKSGRVYWEEIRVQPVFSRDGQVEKFTAIGSDVTAQKLATAEILAAKNAAEAASRAKSAFLATMSHEIRTPLNGILGMVELLYEKTLDPEQRQMVGVINDSAQALLQVISDVLDLSKIEADKLTLDPVPVMLEDFIESVVRTLSPLAVRKELQLIVDVASKASACVEVDPLRLRQVLFNLGSNAIKFTDHQPGKFGTVRIRLELEPIEGTRAMLMCSVRDNGIGMSDVASRELFEPFVQADASTTRRFGGTGLGLAIVRRLCTLAGGDVAVTSAPSLGSEFTVRWPVNVVSHVDRVQVLRGVSVIVIAPDAEIGGLQERYLIEAGATVLRSSVKHLSGEHALLPPHVVVIDEDSFQHLDSLHQRWPDACFVVFARGAINRASMPMTERVVLAGAPLSRESIVEAALVASGRASPAMRERYGVGVSAGVEIPTVEQAERAGRLILIAEDNDINRMLIRRQLESLGYASEVAEDGRAALERMRTRKYGLLLTDCHMPDLDGFELARIIRYAERQTGEHLPIIAVTANAMAGEFERCRAAGMDEYLAKPIALKALRMALRRWLPTTSVNPSDAPIDMRVLASLVGDDAKLQASFFTRFVDHGQKLVAEIAAASGAHDLRAVRGHAHKLKSSSAAVGARVVTSLCGELEVAAGSADGAEVARLAESLTSEMLRVEAYLQR